MLSTGQKRCLLELGAGVGHTLYHLAGEFQTVAVDRSPRMLGISRKLNSTVTHIEADFRDLNLSRSFDVVLAHDSLDYMVTEQDLRAAITSAAQHLQPGGLLALEAIIFQLSTPHTVLHELESAFPVILLLIFMVAGIYFMKDLLLFTFTKILLGVRSKALLSFLFCFVAAFLSAFLDALTVTAVIIKITTRASRSTTSVLH